MKTKKRPKSLIHTPNRDDEQPRPFHLGVPPGQVARFLELISCQRAINHDSYPEVHDLDFLIQLQLVRFQENPYFLTVCHSINPI